MALCWKLIWFALGAFLLLAIPTTAQADGLLPALPYRYLHPPPALAANNQPPVSGLQVYPADYLRKVTTWTVFTLDGQAGVAGKKGSLLPGPNARGVIVRVDPVDTPPGLPAGIVANGNAYRITAQNQPDKSPVQPTKKVSVFLTWPHVPIAIYIYTNGAWKQLCYSDQSILTGKTMSCTTSELGIFQAVTNPSGATTPTPVTGSRFSWINKYIPLIAALLVVIAAAVAAYFVSRPGRRAGGDT